MRWIPLTDPDIAQRISLVLRSWEGTPYQEDSNKKRLGTNCVGFFTAFLDEMYGEPRAPFDRLPPDLCFHRPATARAALRKLIRLYAPCFHVTDGTIEPGDILISAPPGGGPGHALIADIVSNRLWHADNRYARVQYTSPQLFRGSNGDRLHAVYRSGDKHLWKR